ncbi:MAG: MarR family transcriptional regulator, partial [Microlunatus sp.]|nr:MarR family transcriptional regulator [Microlunatus sp.]
VADVLTDHVVFEIECIDRMYCNVYVPQLQHAGGLIGYIQRQLGLPIASTAPLGKITDAFSAAMRRFARDQQVPWVDFVKHQRKDDVMHEHLARFTGTEGVLFIGRAQEKTSLFRTERRRDAAGDSYPWIVRSTGVINQFYVYAVDEDFGPFFLKFCSYFPYNAKLCINGHEWGKRQATKAGIGHSALDNGFATCDDPAAVQAICDQLGPEQIDALLRKWLARLPHPFSAADREAGYRYDISIWQAEFSLTQVLDRPISGRVFFEHVIRDNLDAGRPDQVSLIFDRQMRSRGPRPTPGRFRTRVITEGVTPSLHIDYKSTSIKQYHKEGRALRTETTINNARDFGIGKRLTNLPALREIGLSANRRLLGVQRLSHNPIRAAEAFTAVHDPIVTDTGARIAGLRLGDRRAHALLQALLVFRLLTNGFTNRDLRSVLAQLLGRAAITAGQMSYDLRRLRAHGLITRIPRSHRYRLTETGLHHAMLLSHVHNRLLLPGLAQLTDPDPPEPSPLRTAARAYQQALEQLTREAGLAA